MKKFLLVVVVIASMVACKETKPIEAQNPYQYKTEYLGDNSKVIGIVNNLTYPKEIKIEGIEILSQEEPYGLKVFVQTEENLSEEDLFESAAITFALIDNLSYLYYIDKETDSFHLEYSRENIEAQLKDKKDLSLKEIGESPENIEAFLK